MNESKTYDEIVSLGYNCEISFRIEDYCGHLNSWPFSWTYILDRDKFVEQIDNGLFEILQDSVSICKDARVNAMVQCDKTLICFHPRDTFLTENYEVDPKQLVEATEELKSRFNHLKNKFKNLLEDNSKQILFIVGLADNGEKSDEEFVENLYNALHKQCKTLHYMLIVVCPRNRISSGLLELENDHLKIRTIKGFGVQKYNDVLTDVKGWFRIFNEFIPKKNYLSYIKNLNQRRIRRVYKALKKRIVRK